METTHVRPRSVTIIGILSVVIGAIQVLGLPLALVILNVWRVEEPIEALLTVLMSNIHWGGPEISLPVSIVFDIPLAIVLIRSGRRTLAVQPAGRRLGLLYAGIVLVLEGLNLILIATHWEQWTRAFERPYLPADPTDFVLAGLAFLRKISYPIVLVVFFSLPGIRALFMPRQTIGKADE